MILELLNRARRRVIAQLLLDKGALALTIGMAAAIALLLFGTQILDWYWPVLIALVSLSIGTYQLRAHIPSLYGLAQRIDRRLSLADALSTAVYFGEHPKPGSEDVCEAQRRSAEQTARGVALEQALPYERSRWLAPALGLMLVAAGLFAVRYAVVGSLDLSSSLVEMAFDTFFQASPDEVAKSGSRADLRPQPFDPTQPPSLTEEMGEVPEETELLEGEANPEEKGKGEGNLSDQETPEAKGQEEDGSPQDKDKQGNKGESKEDDKQSEQEGESENRSMLDKLRDAVSNLLNQMKSDDNKQEQRAQQKGDQKGKSGDKGSKGQKGEKSDKGEDKAERADGSPQQDSQQQEKRDQEGQPGEAPGAAQEEAQAGAGKQEGKKDLEQAKMLEAMGKVSELLGQRSQQVTGEMMIEVGATKQQLRTQYSDRKAGHGEAGSEIHRDEIPLLYQPYVERYFEEIRKAPALKGTTVPQAAKGKAAAPKGSGAPKGKG